MHNDNLALQKVIDVAIDQVHTNPESFDHIQARIESKDRKRRGGGYPGPQIGAGTDVSSQMLRCIKPVMAEYFPYIDQARTRAHTRSLHTLLTVLALCCSRRWRGSE